MAKGTAEEDVRRIVESWAAAVRKHDLEDILAHHTDDFVMYDVPPPFESRGIEAYKKTWEKFYNWAQDQKVFDILKLEVVAGEDVAFCYATMRCAGYDDNDEIEKLKFRLTIGLQKIGGKWMIRHEHHSIPGI
jgi:uncharacterized protein (TIGR02246 family)